MKRSIKVSVPIVVATKATRSKPMKFIYRSYPQLFEFDTIDDERAPLIARSTSYGESSIMRYSIAEGRCYGLHMRDGVTMMGHATTFLNKNVFRLYGRCQALAAELATKLQVTGATRKTGDMKLSAGQPAALRDDDASEDEVRSQLDWVIANLQSCRLYGDDIYCPIGMPFIAMELVSDLKLSVHTRPSNTTIASYALTDWDIALSDLALLGKRPDRYFPEVMNAHHIVDDGLLRQAQGLLHGFCVAFQDSLKKMELPDFVSFVSSLSDEDRAWLHQVETCARAGMAQEMRQQILALAKTLPHDIPRAIADAVKSRPWFATLASRTAERLMAVDRA